MDKLYCRYCGALMGISAGTSHHIFDPKPPGAVDDIDHNSDADHVAVPDEDGVQWEGYNSALAFLQEWDARLAEQGPTAVNAFEAEVLSMAEKIRSRA
jgi:hypothetical protein